MDPKILICMHRIIITAPKKGCVKVFKLRQGASIIPNVCWSVGRLVGRSVRRNFVKSKIQNSSIIFDYLIIFWNCLERGCSVGLGVGGGGVRVIG